MSTLNMSRVLCYTRKAEEDAVYSEKLAYSMHLAVDIGDGEFRILNHNAGILYAKATQNCDGTLNAMSLYKPWLFEQKDGSFGVVAIRVLAPDKTDKSSTGMLLYFTSDDLISYEEHELLLLPEEEEIEDCLCLYRKEEELYQVSWKLKQGKWYQIEIEDLSKITKNTFKKQIDEPVIDILMAKIPGALPRNIITVSDLISNRLLLKLTVPINIANKVPKKATISSLEELKSIKTIAYYSDGSQVEKKVDWNVADIDINSTGTQTVRGTVHQEHFSFPLALNRADPCIGKWNGKYYFIATNDADGNHTLYMREADDIAGLVDAPETLILDSDTYPHIGNLLWAPEFHVIKDRLYIFHAATPEEFIKEHSHVMVLKEEGNPMNRDDWSAPKRVIKKDGSMLYGEQGITLDMTEFEVAGRYYCIWSQRQFVPVDQGAWLYIAELNPDEPWKLITDPVLLSMPEYGWANNHTFVDEGPFALITEDKIFITFSSAAVDSTYVVGLLSADLHADLLNSKSWKKGNYPILSCRSVSGEYGTGHNAYVTDDDGLIWNTYHARPGIDGPRSTGIRRVHMAVDGEPVLDMTEEKDLNPEYSEVIMQVDVKL